MADVPYPKALKARPTLRQSLLSTFDDCSLQAKFDLDYRKGWDSHPQARGHIEHEVYAECLKEMARMREDKIEISVALAILHEVLRQEHVDDICHEPGCQLPTKIIPPSRRRKDGRQIICTAGHRHHSGVVNIPMREIRDIYWTVAKWAKDNTLDISHLVSVEERLEATVTYPNPLGGSVERRITGRLDAMLLQADDPEHAIVLDWKSTWSLPAPTEVSFEGYFQQRFYALLVMRNYPSIQQVTLREFYVRYSEPREVTIEREKLPDIEQEISALAERFDMAMQRNVWKPTPGRHCNFCPRPTACPIPTFVRGEGRITDDARAQEVAAQLLVAEVVVGQTRKALKAYCDVNGPIPVKDSKGNTFFGYRAAETEKKPTRAQVIEAERLGLPISAMYSTRGGTRFQRYTLKPGEEEAEADKLTEELAASLAEALKRVA